MRNNKLQNGFQKNTAAVLITIVVFLIIATTGYAVWIYMNEASKTSDEINKAGQQEKLIGGDRDEHGCLGPAGYTWCEAKEKCLRIWEEACTSEDALKNYLRDHLSELSPEPEVLGGKFYVTSLELKEPTRAIVNYEDGHNAYQASVLFTYEDEKIDIKKFSLISENPPAVGNDNMAVVALKKIFAEKYDLIEDDIRIEITDDQGEHVKGEVWFFPQGAGNSGIFLAAMVDGQYQLIFDGNGSISCEALAQYSFPQQMIENICY